MTRHIGYVKAYKMRNYIILVTLLKVNSFSLSHPQLRILDGSLFHCCFLLVVYMIHLVNGGATLMIGSMDLHIEERSDLLDAPSTSTHATTSSIGTPTPPYLLIVLTHVMLDGHIIHMTNLHLMHGLTHIMIALLHLFPCHP